MTKKLTCIVCPMGCQLSVELDENKKVLSVCGNTCKRGEVYAQTECTAPKRTITTTVALRGGGVIPVKTDKTVPKELIFECMDVINRAIAEPDTRIGDVIIENILGTGSNVIATRNAKI
ncbi:MAG: DUF1667 domain-containing protein [Ruminococcaceae bacterium]|nr:DUF1667 domain-containing protein [Oscillospiraceae bacterium]